jgi:two-component system response regulator VicR
VTTLRVLVVDDSRAVATLIRDLLTSSGYAVTTAYDGEAALDHVKTLEPDVVLLDLTLPSMTGIEVLGALRRTHPRIPVIAMTGDAGLGTSAVEAGAVAFLEKPFGLRTLEETLRAVQPRS